MIRYLSLSLLLTSLLMVTNLTGCASILSQLDYEQDDMYYRGTALDLAFVLDDSLGHGSVGPGFRFLCLVDLPLSFALDTILLPVHLAVDLSISDQQEPDAAEKLMGFELSGSFWKPGMAGR
ncbi:MAG: YceK/YidQ family lipoprotein [Leptospiraceae bacterium]